MNEIFRADLHCHSSYSDGTLSPEELVQLAIQRNLQGLVITDHDTVMAYPDVLSIAEKNKLLMVPGVEFSTQMDDRSVHILGYSFDYTHPKLLKLCQQHKLRRMERNLQILEKLRLEGFFLEPEEILKNGSSTIGRPHIAQALVAKGYLPDLNSAFQNYLGDQKKCYVAGTSPSVEETLAAIHAAQGFAVLAHPHIYHNHTFVRKLLNYAFDGVEAEYAQMPPAENRTWLNMAKERNLFTTGGSDYHGATKPMIALGCTTVGYVPFEKLLTQFKSHHP
jgi:3',5'-nucleoside bisphosphate phosphatase